MSTLDLAPVSIVLTVAHMNLRILHLGGKAQHNTRAPSIYIYIFDSYIRPELM